MGNILPCFRKSTIKWNYLGAMTAIELILNTMDEDDRVKVIIDLHKVIMTSGIIEDLSPSPTISI